MARIGTIKPDLFTSDDGSALSPLAKARCTGRQFCDAHPKGGVSGDV